MPASTERAGSGDRRGADFTEGSVARHVARLATFMSLGFVAMTVSTLIEAVYLGVLGTDELAAIAFTFPLTMGLGAFARGIGIGASSVVARSIGSGDRTRAARLVSHCGWLIVAFAGLVILLGVPLAAPLLATMGAEGRVLELAADYMVIWFFGFPLFALSMVGTGLMRSAGDAAFPGYLMTVGSVLQVVIGPFLIFGWFGAPDLGMDGAAWAFVLARSVSFLMTLWWFARRERLLAAGFDGFAETAREILHVGLPAAATNLIQPASTAVITRLLADFGADVVAGFGVASRVESLVGMIAIALSSSAAPMVGQNWGAGRFDRVRASLAVCYRFCIGWGVLSGIAMLLAGRAIVTAINEHEVVVATATSFLLIVPWSLGFMGVMNVASSSFNALGKPLPPLVLSLSRMLVLYIPLAVVASRLWGYVGVFWATAAANVVMGIVAWAWNRAYIERALREPAVHADRAGVPAALVTPTIAS